MKIVEWKTLVDVGEYSQTPEFKEVKTDLEGAVAAIQRPLGSGRFSIAPVRKGNGVVPIKLEFMKYLEAHGWDLEIQLDPNVESRAGAFDCVRFFGSGVLPFGVEWETGNISSSHRAMNRIGLNVLDGFTSGGILVVPSRELYPYLTDRIGNERELIPYHSLWERWDDLSTKPYYLGIVVVEHDSLDDSLPLIPKGTDGRSPLSAFRAE